MADIHLYPVPRVVLRIAARLAAWLGYRASGADERVVSRTAQKKLCSRLQDCRFVDIMHAKHEILRKRDPVRAQFWNAFDGFVSK